jgi:hypothetical protein
MSNKFTGITSAGSAIPVYDKDAHEALSSKLDTTAFSSVSGEFATVDDVVAAVSGKADTSAIPSLDGYATQEWVGEQGYLTEVPAGYATTEDVISATSGLQPSGDYASATDLANYQPVSAMTAFQPVGDYYSASNPSGFLIADDITGKMDVTGMTAYQPAGSYLSASESANFYPMTGNPSGFLTEHQSLDGYLQNTDLTIVDNKITEISGVPLSAGDELPSGVMNTSALGYNAVNEISGYNGSAIAQYGAEKQWLVHDDTLVHAANSAQYALGVNLSAVAQLLGVDETVLWSGSNATALNLSEPASSFNKIKVYYGNPAIVANNVVNGCYEFIPHSNYVAIHSFFIGNSATNATYTVHTIWSGVNTTTWNRIYYAFKSLASSSWNTEGNWQAITKVIGIGRKQ